jgi:hypothetical protein
MVIGEERSEDNNKLSCVLLQTLSYNGASATDLPNPPTSTVTTPRKRRLGEAAPTLTAAPLRPSPPTTIDADLSLVMSLEGRGYRARECLRISQRRSDYMSNRAEGDEQLHNVLQDTLRSRLCTKRKVVENE